MTKPWPQIVARYREYPGEDLSIKALLALSEHIANGPLSQGLFAWTSMFDLCITQTEVTYPYNGPYLRVSPMHDGLIEFRYIDTFQTDRQWHREVPGNEAIPRLSKFLAQLHWFSSEVLSQ
jgi:hypothetical protein